MSLRPCIAKLPLSFWATRRHVQARPAWTRRVEQRPLGTRALPIPIELRETVSTAVFKNLKGLHEEMKAAMEKRNANDLCFGLASSRRVFFTLPKVAWDYVRENHLCLTKPELEQIAHVLARRGKKGDAEALGQLLRDAKAMYGVEPTPELLLSALRALVRTAQHIEALDLLQLFYNYKTKPFRPNSRHWRAAMWGLAQIGDVQRLKECLNIMKNSWPFPKNSHYLVLLEGVFRRGDPPSADEVYQVLDELQKFRLPYDGAIYDVLFKISKKYGFDSLARAYKERCDAQVRPTDDQLDDWLKQLIAYRKRAKSAFEWKLNSLRHNGFVPEDYALRRLVQMTCLASSDELTYLQETLELPPNIITWTICMRNILEKGGWKAALAAYHTAKAQGITPDAAMVHPLLRAMCSRFVQETPESVLDQALEIYRDLNEDAKSSGRPGADTAVFNTLLRALAASKNKQKFFPIALQVLDDMRSQGVYMDRMTATSVAVLLVRSSSTYEEAAEAYKHIRGVNTDGLDEKGFAAVLHAFCTLEADNIPSETDDTVFSETKPDKTEQPFSVPPAKLYFKILQDMYAQGLRKTAEVYTILLGRYAQLATRARNVQDPLRRDMIVHLLRDVIKETHRQFSVEAGLQPDAPLLNQLMDAYNRVGLFRDVIQVWTMLNSTGLVSSASVSIFFDACGHNKQSEQANAVFHELKERDFQFNRRNWNAWVECLCRLNRLDEALKTVCSDMLGTQSLEARPDRETLQIILSFASAHDRLDEVRSHLKIHIPNL